MFERGPTPTHQYAAIGAAVAAFVFATSVVIAQVRPQRTIVYTHEVEPAPGMGVEVQAGPVSPIDLIDAIQVARVARRNSLEAAAQHIPEVPWNEYGLARVAIDPARIRFDESRARYVADLPEGRLAVLTLHPSLQRHLEDIVGRHPDPMKGVVVIDPQTGAVLGMADARRHDAFPTGGAREAFAYAASIFKVITGATLLTEGVASLTTEVCFSGGSQGFDLASLDAPPGEDCRSLTGAMGSSANLYFARLADRHLTPRQLQSQAEAFGFNTSIPFELPVARSRVQIPTDRLGFARSAAGFYGSWLSPFHGALIEAAIANEGTMMVPTIVESIEDGEGTVLYRHRPTPWRQVLSPAVAQQVQDSQRTTCTVGTGRRDFGNRPGWPSSIQVFGKTGTLANRNPETGLQWDPPVTYTWFTGIGVKDGRALAVGALSVVAPEWHVRGTWLASEAILAAPF